MKKQVNTGNVDFFMALASKTRLQIIELLAQQPMNIINLRKKLGVSSAMISKHVKQMEEAGILECETLPGERGNQKICKLALSELTLAFNPLPEIEQYEEHVIPVGSFVDYTVKPPCGLASSERYIGFLDDTRSFSLPDRSEASLVWFNSGYVSHRPSRLIVLKSLWRSVRKQHCTTRNIPRISPSS